MFKAFQNYLNEIDEVDILEVSQAICDSFMISYTSVILYYPGQVYPLIINIAVITLQSVNDPSEQLMLTFNGWMDE